MKRTCYLCCSEILECMGSVHAGSFLSAVRDNKSKVHELCPKCASRYANATIPTYPSPYKEITTK